MPDTVMQVFYSIAGCHSIIGKCAVVTHQVCQDLLYTITDYCDTAAYPSSFMYMRTHI